MDTQRTGGDSGRMDDLERRLDNMEDRQGALERSREVMNAMVPAETRKHIRAAWRHNLLAVRSLLDVWINRLDDDAATKAQSNGDGRESIPIE
jgi:hypothetical protein